MEIHRKNWYAWANKYRRFLGIGLTFNLDNTGMVINIRLWKFDLGFDYWR
jgi:hypothetical protein